MAFSDSRLPNVTVLANGSPVSGIVDVDIVSDSFVGANRFGVSVSLDASGYPTWADNAIDLEIVVDLDGASQSLIVGPVDRVSVDLASRLVRVDGRDLTARLIEARTQETFENRTSSEIVTLLAERRGLVPNVTTTSSLVGRDFDGGYTRTTLDQYCGMTTEWDLLAKLADTEGFDVWVDGRTLNFSPLPANSIAFTLRPEDCVGITLERTLSLCQDIQVSVKSWDCRGQQVVSQTAGSVTDGDTGHDYVLIRPNLTQAAAASLASTTLQQMTQNARVITVEMPGDLMVFPRQAFTLAGTGTDFDRAYVVTRVERRLSFAHGFTQTFEARTPSWIAS